MAGAGLRDVSLERIELEARYEDFDDYWDPLAVGIGPTGSYLLRQTPARRDELREGCREILGHPAGPFTLPARATAGASRIRVGRSVRSATHGP